MSLFDRLSGKFASEAGDQAQSIPAALTKYRAIVEARPGEYPQWLLVHYSNGDETLFHYGQVVQVVSFADYPDKLSIVLAGGGYIDLTGEHLLAVLYAFRQSRISDLYAFNPDRHLPPTAAETIITEIELIPPKG